MLIITQKFNCFVTFFLDEKSNQKNQGFSFNLTHRSFNAPTIVLRSESFFTLLNSLKCRWSPMELSPFLSVSVRVKNHFMKCQRKRMANFGGGVREKRTFKTFNGFKEVQMFNSSPFRHAQCNALLSLQRGKLNYGEVQYVQEMRA